MASSLHLPSCLNCGSKKYKTTDKRYYSLELSIKCGSQTLNPYFLFSKESLFLCQTCYMSAYRNAHFSSLPSPDVKKPTTDSQEKEITIYNFSLDEVKESSSGHAFPKISKVVQYWKNHLPPVEFQSKILAVLNNRDYLPDFNQVLPTSIAFKKCLKKVADAHQDLIDEVNLMMSITCGISQKKMQDLRLQLFSRFLPIFHFNPISPVYRITDLRRAKTEKLLRETLGFTSIVREGKVAVVGCVEKIINYLLSQAGSSQVYLFPKNVIPLLLYTDAYPFFRFSENCNSQTSIQLKLLTPHKFCDVFPLCRWFGDDDPDSTQLFLPLVFSQFDDLAIVHKGQKKLVKKILISDGKNRRGQSTKLNKKKSNKKREDRRQKKKRKKKSNKNMKVKGDKRTNNLKRGFW